MSKLKKILLLIPVVLLGLFVISFIIYFFNLDMKATSLLEPLLEKWYDRVERKQYI